MGDAIGRTEAIRAVLAGSIPVTFGSPAVMIVEQDGRFRIRELVVDQREAASASSSASRSRSPSWMPEHHYLQGRPTGKIYIDATSREELVAAMREMEWPESW